MKPREIAQYILGGVVVVGFIVLISFMVATGKAGTDILIGAVAAAFGSVVGYFFGSSAGSAAKTEMLERREGQ